MMHQRIQRQFYDYLQGELTIAMEQEVEQHLRTCKICNDELDSLRSTLARVPRPSSSPADALEPEYWDQFATGIIERISVQDPKRGGWWNAVQDFVHDLIVPQRRILISIGGAIAVVGAIAFGWKEWRQRLPEESFSHVITTEQTGFVEDPLGQYFRRSKILLVGLSNLKTPDGTLVDLSAERSASRELIREARAFGDEPLDPRSTLLLRDLQKILIELANMEQTTDIPNVEIIRSGIRQENLLFKIRMAEATRDSVRLMQAKYSF